MCNEAWNVTFIYIAELICVCTDANRMTKLPRINSLCIVFHNSFDKSSK